MKNHDIPPGQKRMVLSGSADVKPGDILHERGPKIGQRFWEVTYIEKAQKYWHAAVRLLTTDEVPSVTETTFWDLRRK